VTVTGRNAPCRCGGKRFKDCCGSLVDVGVVGSADTASACGERIELDDWCRYGRHSGRRWIGHYGCSNKEKRLPPRYSIARSGSGARNPRCAAYAGVTEMMAGRPRAEWLIRKRWRCGRLIRRFAESSACRERCAPPHRNGRQQR
jgi:hypothetical protein